MSRLLAALLVPSCTEEGHSWRSFGGCNAGCCRDCGCSVPVHECTRCGDCDYGDNLEAADIRDWCRDLHGDWLEREEGRG